MTPRGFQPCPLLSRMPPSRRRRSYFERDRGSLRDGRLVGCRILAAPSEMEIWEKPTSEFKPLGWSQNRAEANPDRLRGKAECKGRRVTEGAKCQKVSQEIRGHESWTSSSSPSSSDTLSPLRRLLFLQA